MEPLLLEVGAGDARGIFLGAELVDLADLGAILTPGDGGGIARRRKVRTAPARLKAGRRSASLLLLSPRSLKGGFVGAPMGRLCR